jgi:hypothetical protein
VSVRGANPYVEGGCQKTKDPFERVRGRTQLELSWRVCRLWIRADYRRSFLNLSSRECLWKAWYAIQERVKVAKKAGDVGIGSEMSHAFPTSFCARISLRLFCASWDKYRIAV